MNRLQFPPEYLQTSAMKLIRLVAAVFVVLPLSQVHAEKGAAIKPGSYQDWHDVDEVTIVQPFQLASYNRVVVQSLDTKGAQLPEEKDNSYAAVKGALANSTAPFTDGVRAKLGTMPVENGKAGAKALVVRARIMKSDPGSQAARYFAGFGAGAAKVGISGEIVDGGTNKVLLRFTQERRSAVGAFGGGYQDLLHRSVKQIGVDVAGLLRAF
ncbi:MAG: DUF4410 domain-containing protein [Chthoniobacterales bacterium]